MLLRNRPEPLTVRLMAEPLRDLWKICAEEMRERDRRDRNRAESPLRPASDAVILDSTSMTLEEVLSRAEQIVREHLPPQLASDDPSRSQIGFVASDLH